MEPLDAEAYARAVLTYLAEPGDLLLAQLVRAGGAAQVVAAVRSGRRPVIPPGADPAVVQRALARWQARLRTAPARDEVLALGGRGIRLICPGDAEWPAQLAGLGDAQPYALWLRGNGDLRAGCARSVAIVGSTAATAYGSYVAAELAASVAAGCLAVASGGSFGIEAAACRGVLAAEGASLCVLPCGVDVAHPPQHAELFEALAHQGVLVSELPPGSPASRPRYLARARLLAALPSSMVVVEAHERSGAMTAARWARDLGRSLMAVPGPVTSGMSAGSHHIIREWRGALVTCAADVLELAAARPARPSQRPALGPGAAGWELEAGS